MAATRKQAPAPARPVLPYWIAKVPLPVGDEMGSGAPRAFSTGDWVPAGHIEQFGWQDYVEAPPGDWTAPEPAASKPDGGTAAPEQE